MTIELHTREALENIRWTLSSTCRTINNGDYGANRIYSKKCDLIVGNSYVLSCQSANGDGWKSGFVLIENVGYCEDFLRGGENTHNLTITGKI